MRRLIASALFLALVVVALPSAAARPAPGSCKELDRFFYVKSAHLDETITAHWNYDDGAGNKAAIDTQQTGTLDLPHGKPPSKADLHKDHGFAFFIELQGGCRIPNYRQGKFYDAIPMQYTLHGDWKAGGESGSCDATENGARVLRSEFIRRSLNWRYPTVGWRWENPTASMPACRFDAADAEGHLVERRLQDAYPFSERSKKDLTLTKKALLDGKTLTLSLAARGTKTSGGSTWHWDLSGRVVLQRFSPRF